MYTQILQPYYLLESTHIRNNKTPGTSKECSKEINERLSFNNETQMHEFSTQLNDLKLLKLKLFALTSRIVRTKLKPM